MTDQTEAGPSEDDAVVFEIPPAPQLYRYPISETAAQLYACHCGDRARWRIALYRATPDGYYRCDDHAAEYPENPDALLAYRLPSGQGVLLDGSYECHSDAGALLHYFDREAARCRCGQVAADDPVRVIPATSKTRTLDPELSQRIVQALPVIRQLIATLGPLPGARKTILDAESYLAGRPIALPVGDLANVLELYMVIAGNTDTKGDQEVRTK